MAGGGKSRRKALTAERQASHFFEEVTAFLLLVLVFAGLLWQGLLYERDIIPAVILLAILAGAVLLKARVADGWAIRQPLTAGLFLLLAAAAALALSRAVYLHNALFAMSKHCTVLLVVLAVQAMDGKIPFGRWLARALLYAGVLYALLGLDAVWGGALVSGINALLNGGPLAEGQQGFLFEMMTGGRLRSVFQYPNTTASFLIAAWFAAAHQYIFAEACWKPGTRRKAGVILAAGGAGLIFAAFVLTVSRGMYLIAVPMLLLYPLILPREQIRRSILRYLLCFIPGLVFGALSLPGTALANLGPAPGWLLMLLLFAFCGASAVVLQDVRLPVNTAQPRTAGKEGAVAAAAKSAGAMKTIAITLAVAAVCLAGALAFAWQYSRPVTLGKDQPVVRLFTLADAGDYQAVLRFDQPIGESMAGLRITLEGQDRQEMLRREYMPYAGADLVSFIGGEEAVLPFSLAESGMYLRLTLYDAGEAAGGALVSASVGVAGGKDKPLKLSRLFFSESMIQGIETAIHPQTMYERFGFYIEGFRIFRDYALSGIGGDCWRYLYQYYQNYPYIANDLHSFAMQLVVEYGICGIAVFLGFLVLLIMQLIRCVKHKEEESALILMIAGGLFAHSLIDVDFTFYGQYLIFAMAFASMKHLSPQLSRKSIPALGWVRDGAVLAVLALACLWPVRFGWANNYRDAYFYSRSTGQFGYAAYFIDRAVKWDPFKPEYKAAAAMQLDVEMYNDESLGYAGEWAWYAEKLAAEAEAQGRYSADTLRLLKDYYFYTKQYEKAWDACARMAWIQPFSEETWLTWGKLAEDIQFQYYAAIYDIEHDEGGPGDPAGLDGLRELYRYWLVKGLSIPDEMKQVSAGRWVPIEPAGELAELLAGWQRAIEKQNIN